jgi:hypothetical protein
MSVKKAKTLYFFIFCICALGCLLSAIIGVTFGDDSKICAIIFSVCAVLLLIATFVFSFGSVIIIKHENDLILQEYGAPESKSKTYYVYIKTNISIPALFPKPKSINNFKFSSDGLYYNDKKEIFLWKNVSNIKIILNALKIEAVTRDGVKFTTGFPNNEIYLKLLKTFYAKEIESAE